MLYWFHRPQLGTEPATEACALTGNGIEDLSLCKMPNQLSHTFRAEQFFIFIMDSPSLGHSGSRTISITCTPSGAQRSNFLLASWSHIGPVFQFLEQQLPRCFNHVSLSTITKAEILNSQVPLSITSWKIREKASMIHAFLKHSGADKWTSASFFETPGKVSWIDRCTEMR